MASVRAVIIGAGQAGAQGAASLRQAGFRGEIVVLGAEAAPPYQRPPLSKAYLQGALARDRLFLKPDAFWSANAIALRLGMRATRIDRAAGVVETDDGATFAYDRLLIATGAPPRRLAAPGADLPGVRYLRTLEDAEALGALMRDARRLVVVGAGYIGLEVAASARKAGLAVTVLEAAPRPLARVAGPEISGFFAQLHRAHGVDLRLDVRVAGFEGAERVCAVRLADGGLLPCDLVLVGVGAVPEVGLARECGLRVGDGVIVDEFARTSDPAIYAAGDCASFPSPLYGRRVRLESVPNAIEQAKAAAANMADGAVVHAAVPWFWSDQFDVKLQTVGLAHGADETVVRGDPAAGRFSVWSLQGGSLIAVDAVNDPAAFLAGKRLIAARALAGRKTLADPAADLKSLLR